MGRPKLKEKDKKTKLGITISREVNLLLEEVTNNKSRYIENWLIEHLKNITVNSNIDVTWNKDEKGNYKYDGVTKNKTVIDKSQQQYDKKGKKTVNGKRA